MEIKCAVPSKIVTSHVMLALHEDIGQHDLTADLISIDAQAIARVITREDTILCGKNWLNEVFNQLDPSTIINWYFSDGDPIHAGGEICQLEGSARILLTGERVAMNFLQILSATATNAQYYAGEIEGLNVKILDTRKTIPGFRIAQKYAVYCGGCYTHRVGLYDGILIKENHINAIGSISAAVAQSRRLYPSTEIEVEVESLDELKEAMASNADIIMLDNFDMKDLIRAVKINKGKSELEASGGITLSNVRRVAETGVDRISVGALTKDIQSIDLSMIFIN
ncbi:MAG: carboxylating nicotinate-nucleotide diphosphorylase [Piscirickettsiaceae bacterium]|nr:carboxylating nicotinate-nucleotide diphosphorylase [Piscirickettsiaceae bacterium]